MKSRRVIIIILVMAVCAVAAGVAVLRSHTYVSAKGVQAYSKEFADMQARHIKAAKAYGIPEAPIKDAEGIGSVAGLVRVKSGRSIKVAKMSHGAPYLTPSAREVLLAIADGFQKECKTKSLPAARLIVTSMLRTEKDVKELQQKNRNAVANSAHMYGTTFDIAWSYFQCPDGSADGDAYMAVLADVLRKHRKQGDVFVRYEAAQRCFHITANR